MKHTKHDYSTLIIWASALVGMIRYAAAFLSSDLGMITGALSEIVTIALGVSGFAMGILGTLGTTYIFDGWRSKMPTTGAKWNNKFIALTALVMAAFVTEILILVPFTMSRVTHVSVADVLQGGVWWWSTAVVVMPFILIGGVSVGNQIVTVASGQMTGQMSEKIGQMTGQIGQIADRTGQIEIVSDWRKARKQLTGQQIATIAKMSTAEITAVYGIEDRTARRWRKSAQDETTPPFP